MDQSEAAVPLRRLLFRMQTRAINTALFDGQAFVQP